MSKSLPTRDWWIDRLEEFEKLRDELDDEDAQRRLDDALGELRWIIVETVPRRTEIRAPRSDGGFKVTEQRESSIDCRPGQASAIDNEQYGNWGGDQ